MLPFFLILSYMGWFRTDSLEEIIGLDPGTHQGPDNITKHHLALLKRQIDAREGNLGIEGESLIDGNGDKYSDNTP